MLKRLQKLTDEFFGISSSRSSLFKELGAGAHLAFNTVLWVLVLSNLISSQNIPEVPHAANLLLYSIGVAAFSSLFMHVTLVVCPCLSLIIYLFYYFLYVQKWTWHMVSLALSLAVFLYWIIYLLGQKENVEQYIPEKLVIALYVGLQIMFFLWCIVTLGIAQIENPEVIAIKDLNSRNLVILTGVFLYLIYSWKPWPGGWWMIFLLTLMVYLFLDTYNCHVHGTTLDFSCLIQQWGDSRSLEQLLRLEHLPSVLSLSLLIFFLFHKGFPLLKKETVNYEVKGKSFKWANFPTLIISLSPILGLGVYRILKNPEESPKNSYSGFCGLVSAVFMCLGWLYLDYLLCIPFLVLLVPVCLSCLKEIIDFFIPLFEDKKLSTLLPSLMAIVLVPITFNLSLSVAASLLAHLALSALDRRNLKSIGPMAFLAVICLIILVF